MHTPRKTPRRRFRYKIGCVFGVFGCGIVKLDKFCTYPCRGVLHTPLNILRQGFASKTGQVLGVSLFGMVKSGRFLAYPYWENVKPDRFFTYPCRGVLHTPPNILRRWFRCKTGWVLGVSLFGMVKSGEFLVYPGAEI